MFAREKKVCSMHFPRAGGHASAKKVWRHQGQLESEGIRGGGNLGNKLVSGFCRKGKARQGERVRVG